MRKTFEKIKTARAYAKWIQAIFFLLKNPAAEGKVFDIGDALLELGAFQKFHDHLNADEEAKKIIRNRELLADYSLNDLARLPGKSFGQIYANHLLVNNLDPNYYRPPQKIDDRTFPILRLRQAHDIWHVITGFDTSVYGEIGLHAFMLGQFAYPLSSNLIALALVDASFRSIEQNQQLMDCIFRGWKMGLKAQPLFNQKWDQNWQKPLADLRKELHISVDQFDSFS